MNRIKAKGEGLVEEAKRLVRGVEQTISANYGLLMPRYLERIVETKSEIKAELRPMMDDFVKAVHADSSPYELRFAEKFALLEAAAVLLARFNLAPWTDERAREAIRSMYRVSRAASLTRDELALEFLRQLRRLVDEGKRIVRVEKGDSVDDGQRKKIVGIIRTIKSRAQDVEVMAIRFTRLGDLMRLSPARDNVLAYLAEHDMLVKSKDGKRTIQFMVKGLDNAKRRYVCIRLNAVYGEGASGDES